MSTTTTKKRPARAPKVNALGLEKSAYRGGPSTLCKGCGHSSINQRIINAAWALGLEQSNVLKLSGIGCSSKTPAYFLGQSFGFNSVHGRMPAVATGALTVQRGIKTVAVSGDGDTASIGFGQFKHAMRRNVPMVYIVENNGVYGLTKGQFSATADMGQHLKYQGVNNMPPLDICLEALIGGATFVARSFAGHARQVDALLEAALNHHGIAVIDIISPCVTFNNHDGSTKSYAYGKSHETPLHELNFIPSYEEIEIGDYEDEVDVQLHDGSWIVLKQLGQDYDPTDKVQAYQTLFEAKERHKFLTGLFYVNEDQPDLYELLHLVDEPLASLPESKLRPSREALDEIMAGM